MKPETNTYPALTQAEVEEWLEHIPVFAVTDSKGQGVVLKPDDTTSVFYFFMSPVMANATLTQLKSANEELDLRVSAFSLGKIWFNILNAGEDKEVIVSSIVSIKLLRSIHEKCVPYTFVSFHSVKAARQRRRNSFQRSRISPRS